MLPEISLNERRLGFQKGEGLKRVSKELASPSVGDGPRKGFKKPGIVVHKDNTAWPMQQRQGERLDALRHSGHGVPD